MKNIKHVIFIAYQPVTLRFKENFYIERLIKEGFRIEYWDLSELLKRFSTMNHQLSAITQKKIGTYQQLEQSITGYKNSTIFIFDITYSGITHKIFSVFSRQQCITGFFARGALPTSPIVQSVRKRFLSKFKAFANAAYLGKTILNQSAIMARRLKFVKPYNYVFYAGSRGAASIGYGYKHGLHKSSLIPINSFDYDRYLKLKNQNHRTIKDAYCVFLDAYLPFHPDFKMFNLPTVDAENYYKSLNHFFDVIENIYKMKVVIAAHPKSHYEIKSYYGKRNVIKDETAELVQHAAFVLTHLSTSISFAILFKKPIVFIYNNDIRGIYAYSQYLQILNFAKILNASCINIDEEDSQKTNFLPADETVYERYKYSFLTNHESEHEPSESIVIRTLKRVQVGQS